MIKFIHKKHMQRVDHTSKFIIYYNASDIFLGVVLLVLVAFFIQNYLSNTLTPDKNFVPYANQAFKAQIPTITPANKS